MIEHSLDRIISEELFARELSIEGEMFFRIANTLREQGAGEERRLQVHQLGIEADQVEAFLDDHGAKNNQGYCFFRELVASVRGFSRVGFTLGHLEHRLDSYQSVLTERPETDRDCKQAIQRARAFVRDSTLHLLDACREEAVGLGVTWHTDAYPEGRVPTGPVNLRLPHNLGEEAIHEEDRRVAEVASKYLQVCGLFAQSGIRRITEPKERSGFLAKAFTEERARVYEATVHNLQSAYDTYVKGSTLEREDPRLLRLRGHASAAFHLLEAVTDLVHFIDRHEAGFRNEDKRGRMAGLVERTSVEQVILNDLLYWSKELLLLGEELAREILSKFSQLEEAVLQIPDGATIHARPASLIVAIVNHHEMPVEMEIAGATCNAASILEVLICAGSNPEMDRCTFRGDARPLADLKLLFQAGLGEEGLTQLPEQLAYLQPSP